MNVLDDDWPKLLRRIKNNREACIAFNTRLIRRFGHRIIYHKDGKPGHIPGFHRGPYWTQIVPVSPRYVGTLPQSVVDEWRALTTQAVRYRHALLSIVPHANLHFVFPLNLQGNKT